jgi:hypothetical protein
MVPAERGRGNTKKQKFGKQKAEIGGGAITKR